jgi:hypothetical protein
MQGYQISETVLFNPFHLAQNIKASSTVFSFHHKVRKDSSVRESYECIELTIVGTGTCLPLLVFQVLIVRQPAPLFSYFSKIIIPT